MGADTDADADAETDTDTYADADTDTETDTDPENEMGEFRRKAPPPSSATMGGENELHRQTPPPWLRYHECKHSLGLRATTTRCTCRIEAPPRGL